MKRLFVLTLILSFCCISELAIAQQYITTRKVYIPGSIARHNLFSADYTFDDYHTLQLTVGQTKAGTVACGKQFEVVAIDTVGFVFYKIKKNGELYYIHRDSIVDNVLLNSADPNIRPDYKAIVNSGSVTLGMTSYELTCSKGQPKDKNVTVTANHIDEQWVYDWGYVYLENDVVTSYQF